MKNDKPPYNPAVDLLRILAILAVVFIHTTTRTLEASRYNIPTLSWTLFLNQIFRFAVPMFFLISGFVLELNYNSKIEYKIYAKKRVSKIFVPYVFWSFFYFLFVYPVWHFSVFSLSFIYILITGNSSYQLYFIPVLIIFYA